MPIQAISKQRNMSEEHFCTQLMMEQDTNKKTEIEFRNKFKSRIEET